MTLGSTYSLPLPALPPKGASILIVDDDPDVALQLGVTLEGSGYSCTSAANGLEALIALARQPFEVVVSDIKMDGMNGLDLLDRVVELHPALPVILCSGFTSVKGAVDATKRGAYGYVEKPYDVRVLEGLVASAIGERRSGVGRAIDTGDRRLVRRSEPRARAFSPRAPQMGNHPEMLALEGRIERVAASSAPAFIQGETGSGKDLVARAIHASGPRREHPFVAVNVSAIPESLLESELFGHVRGAFTGANVARRGLVLEAHRGTLFLDEIGDMPIGLQAKLLRVLQSGRVRAVGSDAECSVDVRIVTATHRDLPALVKAGLFRDDLYFRIHVLPLLVPPLRARRSDIGILADGFLESARARMPESPVRELGDDARRILYAANWPGNVRELESVMERLVVFGDDATIGPADLAFLELPPETPSEDGGLVSLRKLSERHVARVLAATGGDKRRSAEILGIDLSTLYRWQRAATSPVDDVAGEPA